MNCREVKALLSEFCDQELNQEIGKSLEKHLARCPECQKEYESFQKILRVLKKLKTYDIPRDYLIGIIDYKKKKNPYLS